MKQKTVKFDDATMADLKMFSAQLLNVFVPGNTKEGTLRAKIRAAYQGDEITIMVPDDNEDASKPGDAPPAEHDPRALRGSSSKGDPVVNITIAEDDKTGGKRAVYVGVNGVGMLVPRGKPVDVPWRYYHAFMNANKTVHEQMEDGEVASMVVPSYPMSVNKMPPQDEIDAYLAKEQVNA